MECLRGTACVWVSMCDYRVLCSPEILGPDRTLNYPWWWWWHEDWGLTTIWPLTGRALEEAYSLLKQAFVWLYGTMVTTKETLLLPISAGLAPPQSALRPEAATVLPAHHSVLSTPLDQLRTGAGVNCLVLFQFGFGRVKGTLAVFRDWVQERAGYNHVHQGTR